MKSFDTKESLERYLFEDLLPDSLKDNPLSLSDRSGQNVPLKIKLRYNFISKRFHTGITIQGLDMELTRDLWYHYAMVFKFYHTYVYRDYDDWLETLEDLGDVQVATESVFSIRETAWETWTRDLCAEHEDEIAEVFGTRNYRLLRQGRNMFNLSYGDILQGEDPMSLWLDGPTLCLSPNVTKVFPSRRVLPGDKSKYHQMKTLFSQLFRDAIDVPEVEL